MERGCREQDTRTRSNKPIIHTHTHPLNICSTLPHPRLDVLNSVAEGSTVTMESLLESKALMKNSKVGWRERERCMRTEAHTSAHKHVHANADTHTRVRAHMHVHTHMDHLVGRSKSTRSWVEVTLQSRTSK